MCLPFYIAQLSLGISVDLPIFGGFLLLFEQSDGNSLYQHGFRSGVQPAPSEHNWHQGFPQFRAEDSMSPVVIFRGFSLFFVLQKIRLDGSPSAFPNFFN